MKWQSRCQPGCSHLMFGQAWKVCFQDGLLMGLLVRSFSSSLAVNKIPPFLPTWAIHSVVHDIAANFPQSPKWVMWGKPRQTVVSFITSSWMTYSDFCHILFVIWHIPAQCLSGYTRLWLLGGGGHWETSWILATTQPIVNVSFILCTTKKKMLTIMIYH